MQAKLVTGEIVELEKDCSCLDAIHIGPHWLHMDAIERVTNDEFLSGIKIKIAAAKTFTDVNLCDSLIARFYGLEMVRLDMKAREMSRRNILELLDGDREDEKLL